MTRRVKLPKWLRDIDASLSIRSHFVLSGNVRDHVLIDREGTLIACPIVDAIWETVLKPRGFRGIQMWDPIDAFVSGPSGTEIRLWDGKQLVPTAQLAPNGRVPGDFARVLRAIARPHAEQDPVAMVIDYASRIDALLDAPQALFVSAEKAASGSLLVRRSDPQQHGPACFNPVFWLANRANDLPFWLTADNQRIASIPVPLPGATERQTWAGLCYENIPERARDVDQERFASTLSGLTHGMTLADVENVTRLARMKGLKASEADDAVERFGVGDVDVDDNPWRSSALRGRIADGASVIDRFVKGQERARTRVLDILKRTSIGMTGAQSSSSGRRPRGVLFFAGPTGVGKTEMAKTIARIVFGDPDACLRFDMSEFKGEHSGDRLIGAPPGYVGFDQGGELTNAIRENPFRVVLFDEIEKAHPRILDKFLQVLDDGRLTDGRGETIYFSESLIVFTSNVGIVRKDERTGHVEQLVTRAHQEQDPEEFERKILAGVRNHFHLELQRPELHNRLGENVVVFNYIVREVAIGILDAMIANVARACLEDTSLRLEIETPARKKLLDICCSDDVLDYGGRGIGSKLEAVLVNPLARYVFDEDLREGRIVVQGFEFNQQDGTHEIRACHQIAH